MKKAAHAGGACRTLGQFVPKCYLYKGVRVIEIVIVEDVLVLVCERLVRHGRLVHLTFLGQPGPPAAVNELVEGKGVFLFVGLRRVLVVGVLLQIVLLGIERGQAPELQDAPVAGHGGKFAGGHQLPAQPLVVLAVTFRLAPCPAIRLHGDRGLAQPVLGNLLNGGAFPPTEKNHAVHVAEDGFSVFVINGFALGQLLIKEGQTDLPGADHSHQLFKVRHLSRVGCLVPQHSHMMGQAASVNIVRPFTQKIEHLRKGQRHQKVVGAVGVADTEESCRAPVAHAVKLQLVVGHDLPELGNVKGGQPGAAGNQNAFCGFASNKMSIVF